MSDTNSNETTPGGLPASDVNDGPTGQAPSVVAQLRALGADKPGDAGTEPVEPAAADEKRESDPAPVEGHQPVEIPREDQPAPVNWGTADEPALRDAQTGAELRG